MTANRPPRVAVAGTGTDVGKTHTACALLRALRRAGVRVLALKPVETDFVDPDRSDAAALARAAGHAMIEPRFTSPIPVTPMRAAAAVGQSLDSIDWASWVLAHEAASNAQLTLVETAGGLYSPLAARLDNLELLRALDVDHWLLAAANRLGALHDVLVTLAAVRSTFRLPIAVILNSVQPGAPEHNAEDLLRCGVARVFEDPTSQHPDPLAAHVTRVALERR